MSSIETDGELIQRRMHDAISLLVQASAENDAILDRLFARVVDLERTAAAAALRRQADGEATPA